MAENKTPLRQGVQTNQKEISNVLRDLLACFTTISSSASKIDSLSETMLHSGNNLANIATSSEQSLAGNSAKVDELSQVASDQNAHAAATEELAGNSGSQVEKMVARLADINQVFGNLQKSLEPLAETPEYAEKLVDISSLFRLIAYNTEIEAARLGPAGESISAITGEINRLTNESLEFSTLIRDTIKQAMQGFQELGERFAMLTREVSHLTESIDLGFKEVLSESQSVHRGAKLSHDHCQQINIENKSLLTNFSQLSDEAKSNVTVAENAKDVSHTLKDNVEALDGLITKLLGVITGIVVKNISPDYSHRNIAKFEVIDVRRQEEFNDELGHIEGANLLTVSDDFDQKLKDLDRTKRYLFVCRSGGRSARAARIALSMGFKSVFNMEGGMLAWGKLNLPITRDKLAA